MRVSTGMMFDSGTSNILRNQSSLFKIQNQMSTGRRVLTPADDPVASAQVLVSTQSQNVNKQYMENQANARAQLGLTEGALDSLTNLLHDVRERAVQLGNATLTDKERGFIASEFKARFADLVGIGNQQNGAGQYLFSGFQGATKPFAVNPNATPPFLSGNPAVTYFGDQGERQLQVEASRLMGITASGIDTFMQIRNGNGEFTVSTPNAAPLNAGTAIADQGSMLDISKWNSAPTQPQNYEIQFHVDNTQIPPVTYYNLIEMSPGSPTLGASMFTDAPPTPGPAQGNPAVPYVGEWKVYKSGQAITFDNLAGSYPGADLGMKVLVEGDPQTGDKFIVETSKNQSIFDTFENLINIATQPVPLTPVGNTELMNDLSGQVSALDRALDNVLRVRASIGARLSELDALELAGSDLDLQYTTRISNLQDLDYAEAISNMSRQQMQLEAAQASFVRVTSLSLFDRMG